MKHQITEAFSNRCQTIRNGVPSSWSPHMYANSPYLIKFKLSSRKRRSHRHSLPRAHSPNAFSLKGRERENGRGMWFLPPSPPAAAGIVIESLLLDIRSPVSGYIFHTFLPSLFFSLHPSTCRLRLLVYCGSIIRCIIQPKHKAGWLHISEVEVCRGQLKDLNHAVANL